MRLVVVGSAEAAGVRRELAEHATVTTESDLPPKARRGADGVVTLVGVGDDPEAGVAAARAWNAPVVVVVSSSRIYGASPRHDLQLDETTPVDAEPADPRLAALVASEGATLDAASRAPWRTVVLRVVQQLGAGADSPLAAALAGRRVRTAFGFDPLVQVIHPADVAGAVLASIATGDLSGTFNVCGAGALPLSALARASGTERVGALGGMALDLAERVGLHLANRLDDAEVRYPINVSDERFRTATGWQPARSLVETAGAEPC